MTAKEELARIKKALPKTYYPGLSLCERVEMMVSHWRRLVKVNKDLEVLVEVLDEQLMDIQECV